MTPKKRARPLWHVVLVAAAALVALNALAFFAFTLPRLDRSRHAQEYLRELSETVAAKQAEFDRLSRRAASIEANTRDARRFFSETIKPLPDALAPDLDAIESAVRESRLRADRRSYDERPLTGVPLTRYGMRLPLSGPSSQIGMLLRQLAHSPRFIVIDRIAVRDAQAGHEGQSDFDVELSTYYRTVDGASPDKTQGRPKATRRR